MFNLLNIQTEYENFGFLIIKFVNSFKFVPLKLSQLEKTVLVGIITNDQGYKKSMDYLQELEFLTVTAGGFVNKVFTQKLNNPNPKTFPCIEQKRKFPRVA